MSRFTVIETETPVVHTTDRFGRCLITGDKVVWATINGDDGDAVLEEAWILGFRTALACPKASLTDTFVIVDLALEPAATEVQITLHSYDVIYIETPPAD